MARIACVIAEGMPHNITQRGNGRQQTFFSDVQDDRKQFLSKTDSFEQMETFRKHERTGR